MSARSGKGTKKAKITLRQSAHNALQDFVYRNGVLVGMATFLGPGKYRLELETSTRGRKSGVVRSRGAIRATVNRLFKGD